MEPIKWNMMPMALTNDNGSFAKRDKGSVEPIVDPANLFIDNITIVNSTSVNC